MPTEDLFGAYHFLLEVSGAEPDDSFDFKTESGEPEVGLILPAVIAAQEAERSAEPVDDLQIEEGSPEAVLIGLLLPAVQTAKAEDDGWIDVLAVSQGVNRSDGGDDFMF